MCFWSMDDLSCLRFGGVFGLRVVGGSRSQSEFFLVGGETKLRIYFTLRGLNTPISDLSHYPRHRGLQLKFMDELFYSVTIGGHKT